MGGWVGELVLPRCSGLYSLQNAKMSKQFILSEKKSDKVLYKTMLDIVQIFMTAADCRINNACHTACF